MSRDAFYEMLSDAYRVARISTALYGGRDHLASLAEAYRCRFRYFELASVSAGALLFDDKIYLCFCGSNDAHDWLQNLNASQVSGSEVLAAHLGFSTASKWIRREIVRSDLDNELHGRLLVLGGHSSGGCIAQLFSVDPVFCPISVFTFGSPRVFSSEAAVVYAAYPWETFRFVMDDDPVPRLPMRRFRKLFGKAEYAHTTAPLLLTDDGKILAEQELSWIDRTMRVVRGFTLYGLTIFSMAVKRIPALFKAHRCNRYRDAIEKALNKEGLR